MLMGEYNHSIDAKGRLIIPVRFRDVLGEKFVVTRGMGSCLSIYPMSDWEKMTRKVPDDVMGRTPEEQQRNKKLNDADLLKRLRQGNNPNLEPQQQSDQKQRQANNLTSKQLLDMKKKRANVNN